MDWLEKISFEKKISIIRGPKESGSSSLSSRSYNNIPRISAVNKFHFCGHSY